MSFVNPYFLLASALIIIPIIIHLFNFRKYRKVYFSNVEFLREIKSQTQKTSVLKHLLVLIARMMAIVCLVFAFSQPYIPVSKNKMLIQKNNLAGIYIDNSFSMDAINGNGRLIDEAKNKAAEISSVYKASDLLQILTNDFEGRHQRFVSSEELRQMNNEVKISPAARKLSDVIARQKELLYNNISKSKSVYIISDFQKNFVNNDFLRSLRDSMINFYFIPVSPQKTSNLYIDTIWFDAPVFLQSQKIILHAGIYNNSPDPLEKIPVKLYVNGKQRAVASLSVNTDSHAELVIPYTITETGINSCSLEITDFPVTFDNIFYFSYNVSPKLTVACINAKDENSYLNSLFGADSLISFNNLSAGSLDYSLFRNYSLIILNGLNSVPSGLSQELSRFLTNGGSIAIFPGDNIDMESYSIFLKSMNAAFYIARDTVKTKISEINLNSPLFSDVFEKIPENVDLPVVFSHYIINVFTRSTAESLLKLQNNHHFLSVQTIGKGKLYLFGAPPDSKYSNFPKHPLFVPTLYKIALLSDNNPELYYIAGRNENIVLKNYSEAGENVIKIKKTGSDFEVIPEYTSNGFETGINVHSQIKEAGNYFVYSGIMALQGVAFNYDRSESKMDYYSASQLKEMFEKAGLKNCSVIDVKNQPVSKALMEINLGIRLWKWFVVFALFFIACEVIILRFFRN